MAIVKCTIEFDIDDKILEGEEGLGAASSDLLHAFYAWRRVAQCDKFGHSLIDEAKRCIRCMAEVLHK